MAKDDDSRVRPIRSRKAEHVAKSQRARMIAKHLYIDCRAITLAQMRSKLHFGVLRIIVPDEASNKPHHNRLPGAIGHPLAAQAQGRQATGGEEKQQQFSHSSSMGVPANPCQATLC